MPNKIQKVDLRLPKKAEAPVFKRILAFFVDILILQIILSPLATMIESKFSFSSNFSENYNLMASNPSIISDLFLFFGLIFFVIFAYFVIFEYKLNQTPGKMLFKIYVISENQVDISRDKKTGKKTEKRISFFQALLRNLALIPFFPFYILWIADPLYLIFAKKRLSDNFSKTNVLIMPQPITRDKIFSALKIIGILWLSSGTISFLAMNLGNEISLGKNIAVIPIKGVISVSEGDMFSSDLVSSESIIEKLEKAQSNPDIKAIILDINSPGGSPVATDEISQKIKQLKEKNKTTIAVIREYGASGSYWIASSCDYVFANRMSLVGSIGVIGSYLDFSGLLQRYNITYQRYVSAELKDMGSPFKPASEEEKKVFQKLIDDINKMFIEEVAYNRNLSIEEVKKMATGQVFLGKDAKQLGLIDEIGSKNDAISYIEKKYNITASIIEYKETKSFFDAFLNSKLKIGSFINPKLPTIY